MATPEQTSLKEGEVIEAQWKQWRKEEVVFLIEHGGILRAFETIVKEQQEQQGKEQQENWQDAQIEFENPPFVPERYIPLQLVLRWNKKINGHSEICFQVKANLVREKGGEPKSLRIGNVWDLSLETPDEVILENLRRSIKNPIIEVNEIKTPA